MNFLRISLVYYPEELEAWRRIRTIVFQQEQKVPEELEFDGYDIYAHHLLAYQGDQAVGTARIRLVNLETVKIERLAVLPTARHQGVATSLMQTALSIYACYPKLVVHAQAYIQPFYQKLGFKTVGDVFTEANIPHIKMIRVTNNLLT